MLLDGQCQSINGVFTVCSNTATKNTVKAIESAKPETYIQ